MSDEPIPVPGSVSLKDLYNVIRFREGYTWKFKSAEIKDKMNRISFERFNDVPPDFKIVQQTAAPPEGGTEQWRGKLRYNDTDHDVVLYRLG